jgi:hypothetical protein
VILGAAGAEQWALFFHLVGAFLLVAGVIVAGVAFEAARRRGSTAEVALLLGLTRWGVLLVATGLPFVLAFGLWLVHLERIGYGAGWVEAAIVLFAVMATLGAIGGRRPKEARRVASQLAARGEEQVTVELRALLDDRAALAANYLSAVLAVAIVVLMVFKPGGPS